MDFRFTPEEAWGVAETVATHLRRRKYAVKFESAIRNGAPFRTTLIAVREGHPMVLVDAHGTPALTDGLRALAHWLGAEREYCELFVAVDEESPITPKLQASLREAGIGLYVRSEDGAVRVEIPARNAALVITPDPGLKYWHNKAEVTLLVDRFNQGGRKDALRDLCELLERETELVVEKAIHRGVIDLSSAQLGRMSWANQIEALAAAGRYAKGTPILSSSQKDDFISFKGARNLLDHKAKSEQERSRREHQYAERMMQGCRLVSELSAIRRSV